MASDPQPAIRKPQSLVARLTPRGRGAVAAIAFCGEVAVIDAAGLFRAASGKPLAAQPLDQIAFGHWGEESAEEVVVCRVAADRLEIHCHGGEAAAARILSQLKALGASQLSWREFVEQTDGAFEADITEALASSTTSRTAAIIARQSAGPLREAFSRLAQADPVADRDEVLQLLHGMNRWSRFGRHLTRPWLVVLYGPPNVGKSSLINALVGFERAIVFDQPGTTRDVVTAETAFDGWPIRFSDTAGLRETDGELEAAGIERAKATLADADLQLLVLDRSRPAELSVETELKRLQPGIIVLNKSDLPDARDDQLDHPFVESISAKTGEGVRHLLCRLVNHLVPDVPPDHEPIPATPRQIEAIGRAIAAVTSGDEAAFHAAIGSVAP